MKNLFAIFTRVARLSAVTLASIFFGAGFALHATAQTLTLNGAATTCTSATITTLAGAANIATQPAGCIVTPPATGTNPQLTGVSPSCVALGGTVTVSGANLTGATAAAVNTVTATFTPISATSISVVTPATVTAGVATLTVTTPVGTSNTISYTVGDCTLAPTVASVTPSSAAVGTTITIAGTNLGSPTSVTVNGAVAAVLAGSTATAISTTVPAGATPGAGTVVVVTSGGSASSPFTVPVVVAAGQFVSIEGTVIPNPSKNPNTVPPAHAGLNGASGNMNAYAIDHVSRCTNSTAPITRLWAHSITLTNAAMDNLAYATGSLDFIALNNGEALTYKFTTGAAARSGYFAYNEGTNGLFTATFMSISPNPCDFDVVQAQTTGTNRNSCYVTANGYNQVDYAVTSAVTTFPGYCIMQPNTTYYFNVRFMNAATSPSVDACAPGTRCGGHLQFR